MNTEYYRESSLLPLIRKQTKYLKMELDPDDIFKDEEDDLDNEAHLVRLLTLLFASFFFFCMEFWVNV